MQSDITLVTNGSSDFGAYALRILRMVGVRAAMRSLESLFATPIARRIILAGDLPLLKRRRSGCENPSRREPGSSPSLRIPTPRGFRLQADVPHHPGRLPTCSAVRQRPDAVSRALRHLIPPQDATVLAESFAVLPGSDAW